MTLISSDLPSGGRRLSAVAYSSPLSAASASPPGLELGGSWIAESLTNVITESTTTISVAPIVQPISRRVLPWIWAATAPRRLRNFQSAYPSAPSTERKITSATYSVIL